MVAAILVAATFAVRGCQLLMEIARILAGKDTHVPDLVKSSGSGKERRALTKLDRLHCEQRSGNSSVVLFQWLRGRSVLWRDPIEVHALRSAQLNLQGLKMGRSSLHRPCDMLRYYLQKRLAL